MIICKRCNSKQVIKNGAVRTRQRYRCKDCGYNFVVGDRRSDDLLPVKKNLAILIHGLSQASYGLLGRAFSVSRSLIHKWIKDDAGASALAFDHGDAREMGMDDILNLLGAEDESGATPRRWLVARGEPWPEAKAIIMLQLPRAFSKPK
jgi:transposase